MWQRQVGIPRYKVKAVVNFFTGAVFCALLMEGGTVLGLVCAILVVAGVLLGRQLQIAQDEWLREQIGGE